MAHVPGGGQTCSLTETLSFQEDPGEGGAGEGPLQLWDPGRPWEALYQRSVAGNVLSEPFQPAPPAPVTPSPRDPNRLARLLPSPRSGLDGGTKDLNNTQGH